MATLSPKPDATMGPHFLSGRLAPLMTDRTKETIRMSHILIGAAGMNRRQIDAVALSGGPWRVAIRALLARLGGGRP